MDIPMNYILDDRDLKIINMLEKNARTAFTAIAKVLGVSESTVRKRVGELEKEGVIKGYCVVLDPKKLGFDSVSLVGIDTTPDKFLEVAKKIAEFDEIKSLSTSTGDHMIMAEIWIKDNKTLTDFIENKVSMLDGVTRVCPAIISHTLK